MGERLDGGGSKTSNAYTTSHNASLKAPPGELSLSLFIFLPDGTLSLAVQQCMLFARFSPPPLPLFMLTASFEL